MDHLSEDGLVRDVPGDPANSRVVGMKSLAGQKVDDVVDELAFIESIEEAGKGTQIQRSRTDAQQMPLNSPEFHENRSKGFASRRQLNVKEGLNRVVPDDVVTDRADVVHPARCADELVV